MRRLREKIAQMILGKGYVILSVMEYVDLKADIKDLEKEVEKLKVEIEELKESERGATAVAMQTIREKRQLESELSKK